MGWFSWIADFISQQAVRKERCEEECVKRKIGEKQSRFEVLFGLIKIWFNKNRRERSVCNFWKEKKYFYVEKNYMQFDIYFLFGQKCSLSSF